MVPLQNKTKQVKRQQQISILANDEICQRKQQQVEAYRVIIISEITMILHEPDAQAHFSLCSSNCGTCFASEQIPSCYMQAQRSLWTLLIACS